MLDFRIGHGYDVHKLVQDRKLIIGGVEIPHDKGLLGYSDADVLLHSIMDSILGALALGDIGTHFPDTDAEYKGVSSVDLSRRVFLIMKEKGYSISNLDSTIVAQKPKISLYIDEIKSNICEIYKIKIESVNVKATTEEGLGFTGKGLGIAAHSVVMLVKTV